MCDPWFGHREARKKGPCCTEISTRRKKIDFHVLRLQWHYRLEKKIRKITIFSSMVDELTILVAMSSLETWLLFLWQVSERVSLCSVPYSEHSSYSELRRFVKFLKLNSPKDIIPTVNVGNPQSREAMSKTFQQWMSEDQSTLSKFVNFFTKWFAT